MIFEDEQVKFKAGDVGCVARNVSHTTWSVPENPSLWSYLFVDPEALLGPAFAKNQGSPNQFDRFLSDCHLILSAEEYPWAGPMVQTIIQEMLEKAPGWQSCVRGLFSALLIKILRVYDGQSVRKDRTPFPHSILPALDYIYNNYSQTVPQEALAQMCHLSQPHFRRLFKEQTGASPLIFLHQIRILKSCALLRSSEYSIAQIAHLVGYDSLSGYNRHFKKIMGCAPSRWRRSPDGSPHPLLMVFPGWTKAE